MNDTIRERIERAERVQDAVRSIIGERWDDGYELRRRRFLEDAQFTAANSGMRNWAGKTRNQRLANAESSLKVLLEERGRIKNDRGSWLGSNAPWVLEIWEAALGRRVAA